MGRDPDTLLVPDSALLPGREPHDVILMRCGCGVEGCDCLVAEVASEGDEVVWRRFRDGGDFELRPVDTIGEFRFDAAQYRDEVERAHRERPWEAQDRRAARLLEGLLRARGDELRARGYRLCWAGSGARTRLSPGWEPPVAGVSVCLDAGAPGPDPQDRRYLVVSFPSGDADFEPRLSEIAETLLASDPSSWLVTDDSHAFRP
jgi:hypothetical protein